MALWYKYMWKHCNYTYIYYIYMEALQLYMWKHCNYLYEKTLQLYVKALLYMWEQCNYTKLTWAPWRLKVTRNWTHCSTDCPGYQSIHQCYTLMVLDKGNPLATCWFPSKRTSNTESVSISCRYHKTIIMPREQYHGSQTIATYFLWTAIF